VVFDGRRVVEGFILDPFAVHAIEAVSYQQLVPFNVSLAIALVNDDADGLPHNYDQANREEPPE
jgi:hypothetical protein